MGVKTFLEEVTGLRMGSTERQKVAVGILLAIKEVDETYIGKERNNYTGATREIMDRTFAQFILEKCPREIGTYTHSPQELPGITATRDENGEEWTKSAAVAWATNTYKMDNQGLPLPSNFPTFPE